MQLIYDPNSHSIKTLCHHGILGQKWGIRRYQPYPKGHKGGKEIGEASRKKKAKDMTDEELSSAIERKQKEKRYNEITGENITQGKDFTKNILIKFGTTAVSSFSNAIASKGGQALAALILSKVFPKKIYDSIYKKK